MFLWDPARGPLDKWQDPCVDLNALDGWNQISHCLKGEDPNVKDYSLIV